MPYISAELDLGTDLGDYVPVEQRLLKAASNALNASVEVKEIAKSEKTLSPAESALYAQSQLSQEAGCVKAVSQSVRSGPLPSGTTRLTATAHVDKRKSAESLGVLPALKNKNSSRARAEKSLKLKGDALDVLKYSSEDTPTA